MKDGELRPNILSHRKSKRLLAIARKMQFTLQQLDDLYEMTSKEPVADGPFTKRIKALAASRHERAES